MQGVLHPMQKIAAPLHILFDFRAWRKLPHSVKTWLMLTVSVRFSYIYIYIYGTTMIAESVTIGSTIAINPNNDINDGRKH